MLKFTYNTYTIWDWNNSSYIIESNYNAWPVQELNFRWRQWYDWNILLNKQNREKNINFKVYIKWTSESNLLSKLNSIKWYLWANWLNELTIEDSSWTYFNNAEITWLDWIALRKNWDVNYAELNISFVVPDWYLKNWSTNDIYSNETWNISITWRYPTWSASPQQLITIDFNSTYTWNITLTVTNNKFTDTVIIPVVTVWSSNKLIIDCRSWSIWAYLYDDANVFVKELDPSWSFPRCILLWTSNNISIVFSAAHNANITHFYNHRYL